jgi:hypothetical protein
MALRMEGMMYEERNRINSTTLRTCNLRFT